MTEKDKLQECNSEPLPALKGSLPGGEGQLWQVNAALEAHNTNSHNPKPNTTNKPQPTKPKTYNSEHIRPIQQYQQQPEPLHIPTLTPVASMDATIRWKIFIWVHIFLKKMTCQYVSLVSMSGKPNFLSLSSEVTYIPILNSLYNIRWSGKLTTGLHDQWTKIPTMRKPTRKGRGSDVKYIKQCCNSILWLCVIFFVLFSGNSVAPPVSLTLLKISPKQTKTQKKKD